MRHDAKERMAWTAGLGVVVFYALVPVLWLISLSLKAPASVGDKRLIPKVAVAGELLGAVRRAAWTARCCGR